MDQQSFSFQFKNKGETFYLKAKEMGVKNEFFVEKTNLSQTTACAGFFK